MTFRNIINKVFRRKMYYSFGTSFNQHSIQWGNKKFLGAYETSLYVYGAVKKRATKVGEIEFTLKSRDKDIEDAELLTLLNNPNPWQTKNEFFELYQTYKDLMGVSFIYVVRVGGDIESGKVGKAKELHVLRPDWVTVMVDEDTGDITHFVYRPENTGQEKIMAVDEVIFSEYASPLRRFMGQSPLKAGVLSVETERELSQYHVNVLKNGGKVEGIINYKTMDLTQEQIDDIQVKFKKQFADGESQGKPFITYGGAEYQNLGLTPTELSYLESKKLTRDDILFMYEIPKPVMGITDDVNLANAQVGQAVFLGETIKPLLRNLTNKLDAGLTTEFEKLGFIDPTPEDVELQLKKIENAQQNNYCTINELRVMAGKQPLKSGGDVIMAPMAQIPIEGVEVEKEIKKPGRRRSAKKSNKKITHPLQNEENRKTYFDVWIKIADQRERRFKNSVNRYLDQQMERVLASIEDKQKDFAAEHFDQTTELTLGVDEFLPEMIEMAEESGADAISFVGSSVEFEVTNSIRDTLKSRAEFFVGEMNQTTFKKLQDEFAESLAAGEGRDKLEKRIEATFGDIKKSRSATIARTEVLVASQTGTINGYKQAGIGIKIWVSILDDRTRETHVAIDGEERPIDKRFSNGLMYPGDPRGSAAEVINCRCTI